MPSGTTKRKAAKKNKEQAAKNENSSTNNNPHGNDYSKSQDEGDTYGGDVGSSASQDDHNHHHRFNHREEERERAPSPVESHVTMEKSVDKVTRDAESREKCGLDDVESTHVAIQHVEHDKSSSGTSSSDDESRASTKKSREEAYVFGTVMSEEALKVAGNETHGTEISTNKSGLNESEVKLLLSSDGISRIELEGNEGQVFSYSSSPPAEASNVTEKTQDSGSHDHSKEQPLVASTPPTVQTTSFLSCCGLFDVLTGSGDNYRFRLRKNYIMLSLVVGRSYPLCFRGWMRMLGLETATRDLKLLLVGYLLFFHNLIGLFSFFPYGFIA